MDQQKIGAFIARRRKELNLTQKELADKLGITDRAVSKWENGRCMPDLSLLQPLSRTLGIGVNDLLSGEIIPEEKVREKKRTQYYEGGGSGAAYVSWKSQDRNGRTSFAVCSFAHILCGKGSGSDGAYGDALHI